MPVTSPNKKKMSLSKKKKEETIETIADNNRRRRRRVCKGEDENKTRRRRRKQKSPTFIRMRLMDPDGRNKRGANHIRRPAVEKKKGNKKGAGEKKVGFNFPGFRADKIKWRNSLLLCRVGPGPGVRFPDGALHVHRPATDPTKAASSWNRPSPKNVTTAQTAKEKKKEKKMK